ncbi:MAG: TrmH family RNA methyltransferase [Saprospiraceae bacterium]
MLSKNKIKNILALQRKKVRRDTGFFLLEGDKMTRELLELRPEWISELYALPSWIQKNEDLLANRGITAQEVDEQSLKKVSSLKTPNQVLTVLRQPTQAEVLPDFDQQLSLYLDEIQDPGNMGTILRIADWFGIKHVICSPNCVDVFSPKVVQASMGAIFRVVTLTEALVSLKERFSEIEIYGTLLDGENIYTTELEEKGIIVIGNEGNGISQENKVLITKSITIPQGPNSSAESLNAGIATGIVCAFFRKGK